MPSKFSSAAASRTTTGSVSVQLRGNWTVRQRDSAAATSSSASRRSRYGRTGDVLAVELEDIEGIEASRDLPQQFGAWSAVLGPPLLKPAERRGAGLVQGDDLAVEND
jgi:hypothetical protein